MEAKDLQAKEVEVLKKERDGLRQAGPRFRADRDTAKVDRGRADQERDAAQRRTSSLQRELEGTRVALRASELRSVEARRALEGADSARAELLVIVGWVYDDLGVPPSGEACSPSARALLVPARVHELE